jgi:hypothetical protein
MALDLRRGDQNRYKKDIKSNTKNEMGVAIVYVNRLNQLKT